MAEALIWGRRPGLRPTPHPQRVGLGLGQRAGPPSPSDIPGLLGDLRRGLGREHHVEVDPAGLLEELVRLPEMDVPGRPLALGGQGGQVPDEELGEETRPADLSEGPDHARQGAPGLAHAALLEEEPDEPEPVRDERVDPERAEDLPEGSELVERPLVVAGVASDRGLLRQYAQEPVARPERVAALSRFREIDGRLVVLAALPREARAEGRGRALEVLVRLLLRGSLDLCDDRRGALELPVREERLRQRGATARE